MSAVSADDENTHSFPTRRSSDLYLAKDQTKLETFTITLDDGHGGTVDRTISVTRTGTHTSQLLASTDLTCRVLERETPVGNLTDRGTLAFTDVNLSDTHIIRPTITA